MSFDKSFDSMERSFFRFFAFIMVANVLFWIVFIAIVVLVLAHYGIL